MRLVHTADWHLGHTLHDTPRDEEHRRFLAWLLDVLGRERVDALLIAGDVFETANPTAEAQAAWYGFLAETRRRHPRLDVVVIGGNHDSAARLDAPTPILDELGVRIVGGLARGEVARTIVPLHDARGRVAARAIAVPFLRPVDLPPPEGESSDRLVDGVRRVYAEAIARARAERREGEALIALGHLYMSGTQLSELSERKILGGNQHALPVDVFPEDLAYVALGHLHLAQAVGGRATVRYAGSPIPLSLDEAGYTHSVTLVELEGDRCADVQMLPVPRARSVLRLPPEPAPLDEVLTLLAHLPVLPVVSGNDAGASQNDAGASNAQLPPFLEVRVRLARPEPALRRKIEDALVGKAVRLVRIARSLDGEARALGESAPRASLRELAPEDVFIERYHRDHAGAPPAELLATFHELLDAVARGET